MATHQWTAADVPSQAGKTALITGGNSGIGYQAALALARAGAAVTLAARSQQKGDEAVQKLEAAVPGATVRLLLLDLASQASVHEAAAQLLREQQPLDMLINNAGVMAMATRELTVDGFERQFATNHLGHFALTGLLMPLLQRAEAPRVVTVASLAHRNGKFDVNNLQSEQSYSPMGTYGNTKLDNILFARELDRRVRAAGGTLLSVAVHPGVSRTALFDKSSMNGGVRGLVFAMASPLLFQSDEHGAWPTEYAATMPDVQGGEYIGPDGFMALKGHPTREQPRPQALDEQAGEQLWAASERLTGVVYPPLA